MNKESLPPNVPYNCPAGIIYTINGINNYCGLAFKLKNNSWTYNWMHESVQICSICFGGYDKNMYVNKVLLKKMTFYSTSLCKNID